MQFSGEFWRLEMRLQLEVLMKACGELKAWNEKIEYWLLSLKAKVKEAAN
jgi:hypothetical protein